MRKFSKSHKLDHVCYDIRGPVLEKASEMESAGTKILKLNIGGIKHEQNRVAVNADNATLIVRADHYNYNFFVKCGDTETHPARRRGLFGLKGYFFGKKIDNAVFAAQKFAECRN